MSGTGNTEKTYAQQVQIQQPYIMRSAVIAQVHRVIAITRHANACSTIAQSQMRCSRHGDAILLCAIVHHADAGNGNLQQCQGRSGKLYGELMESSTCACVCLACAYKGDLRFQCAR